MRRLSGPGAASSTVRYDAREHEVDVYVYVCLAERSGAGFEASVRTGGCAGHEIVRLGSLSLLGDRRTAYAHGTKADQRALPPGWWVSVSAPRAGGGVPLFCGRLT